MKHKSGKDCDICEDCMRAEGDREIMLQAIDSASYVLAERQSPQAEAFLEKVWKHYGEKIDLARLPNLTGFGGDR